MSQFKTHVCECLILNKTETEPFEKISGTLGVGIRLRIDIQLVLYNTFFKMLEDASFTLLRKAKWQNNCFLEKKAVTAFGFARQY